MSDQANLSGRGYLVRRIENAPSVPCPCGTSTRLLTRSDGPELNVHVTFIQDSVKHYHKHCTEVYYILEGVGVLELNDEEVEVGRGDIDLARMQAGYLNGPAGRGQHQLDGQALVLRDGQVHPCRRLP